MNKLDVINSMLASMGQAAVNSLDETNPFLDTGLKRLDLCLKRILARGFWFNVEQRTLVPDAYGYIQTPTDLLELRNPQGAVQYTRRGQKIYDRKRQSYLFEDSITVTMVVSLDFDDLPTLAADYIGATAVLEFQTDYDADETKTRRLERRKQEAWVNFNSEDIRQQAVIVGQNTVAHARLKAYGPRLNG